jgi:hypothetical protein
VAYTLAAQPTPDAGDEVYSGQSGLKVYRNRAAFPRAWAVHKLVQAADAGEANATMMEHLAEMHNQAVMMGKPPALEPCGDRDFVELLEHGADRLLIRANMSCPGMVIVSDTYFPGWRARVDGKAAEIYEVNAAMRGVLVPAGLHSVTMRYRPASVRRAVDAGGNSGRGGVGGSWTPPLAAGPIPLMSLCRMEAQRSHSSHDR